MTLEDLLNLWDVTGCEDNSFLQIFSKGNCECPIMVISMISNPDCIIPKIRNAEVRCLWIHGNMLCVEIDYKEGGNDT